MSFSQSKIPSLRPGLHGGLEGTVFLAPWVGYATQEMREANEFSDGNISLSVGTFADKGEDLVVTPEQEAAFEYMQQEAEHVQSIILDELLVHYNESEEIQGFREGMEYAAQLYGPPPAGAEPMLPDVTSPEQFKSLIALMSVQIFKPNAEGHSRVGYRFASWDIEHGLGVLMFRDEVLDIGMDAGFYSE